MEKEIQEYIKSEVEEQVEVRVHASNQVTDRLVKEFRDELRDHENTSHMLRLQFYKELNETVENTIKKVVNGKIDKMQQGLNDHIQRVEPVIKKFEDEQAVLRVTEREGKEAEIKDGKFRRIATNITYTTVVGGAIAWVLNKLNIHI